MKTIFKYRIEPEGLDRFFPADYRVLKVAYQDGLPTIWVEHSVGGIAATQVHFQIHGTGWGMDEDSGTYLDTLLDGDFVWHVYYKQVN